MSPQAAAICRALTCACHFGNPLLVRSLNMASKTRVTDRIRRRKQARKGLARKRRIAKRGSTRSPAELFGD